MLELLENKEPETDKDTRGVFVRIKSCYYPSGRGFAMKRTMSVLRKRSNPALVDVLGEDVFCIGAEDALVYIFDGIKEDGVYELRYHWSPGPWEYPDDGDGEWKPQKVEE
jgi:hypothetical protein